MNIDLREELRKHDELLDGYLKQIEIQEEFIQKQKEMIEFLEDHISITGSRYWKICFWSLKKCRRKRNRSSRRWKSAP